MSANIKWRPVELSGKDIDVWSPSSFIESFQEAFGKMPYKLTEKHLPTLKGLKAGLDIHGKESVQKLIDAVEENSVIEVFAVY